MSSASFEELLRDAIVDLGEMQELESKSVGKKIGASKMSDYAFFSRHWCSMYVRYVMISKKLERVHDQMLQPQKRQDVRVMLDSCIGRMLELKHKMVEYCGEFGHLDEALVDLKLTPEAMEVPIPSYFVEERASEIAARRKLISALYTLHGVNNQRLQMHPVDEREAARNAPMSLEKAVEIIQCAERGRQGRENANGLRDAYLKNQRHDREFEYGNTLTQDDAARKIQNVVRRFLRKKLATRRRREMFEFLGMEPGSSVPAQIAKQRLDRALAARKTRQQGNLAELAQEAKDMRARIKLQEGGRTMEEMLDEVLVHMANVQLMAADEVLPEFPTEGEGGSLALLGRINKAPTQEEEAAQRAAEAAAASSANKPAPTRSEPKKSDKELEESMLPTLQPSQFWNRFTAARDRYVNMWNNKFQHSYIEGHEFDQRLDGGELRKEIMDGPGGVTQELRKCVDQLLMVEVTNLRERLERERGVKRRRKKKDRKPRKRRLPKDPFEGKRMEEHMSRLVALGTLQECPQRRMADFIGTHSLVGALVSQQEMRQAQQADEMKQGWQQILNSWNEYVEKSLRMTKEQFEACFKEYTSQSPWSFEPSMAQVREAITNNCILPLGAQTIHDFAPHHRAVLLYGPPNSGKTLLTQIAATESGSTLFNLSPSIVIKDGPPREGQLTPAKLIQATFRVARALAPSIIYMDDVDLIFQKASRRKGNVKATKMKKELLREVRDLEPTDRVMVIGNSRAPWLCSDMPGALADFFKVMVPCPAPDYSSRLLLWKSKLAAAKAALPDPELESLVLMTGRYTAGTICNVIAETVTERRVRRLNQHRLRAHEFVPALAKAPPIFKEEYEAACTFTETLPLIQRRAKYPTDFVEEVVDDKRRGGGKPGAKPGAKPAAKPGGKR